MSLRRRPGRPSARETLIAALAARGGAGCEVRAVETRSWASATFAGARHRLEVRLPSAVAAEAFEAGLGEVEFSLRGHLLADIAVAGRPEMGGEIMLEVDALMIEES